MLFKGGNRIVSIIWILIKLTNKKRRREKFANFIFYKLDFFFVTEQKGMFTFRVKNELNITVFIYSTVIEKTIVIVARKSNILETTIRRYFNLTN